MASRPRLVPRCLCWAPRPLYRGANGKWAFKLREDKNETALSLLAKEVRGRIKVKTKIVIPQGRVIPPALCLTKDPKDPQHYCLAGRVQCTS